MKGGNKRKETVGVDEGFAFISFNSKRVEPKYQTSNTLALILFGDQG